MVKVWGRLPRKATITSSYTYTIAIFFIVAFAARFLQSALVQHAIVQRRLQSSRKMAVALGPSKRFVILLVLASTTLVYFFISHFRSQPIGTRTPGASSYVPAHHINIDSNTLTGHAIMPKLGNETAK